MKNNMIKLFTAIILLAINFMNAQTTGFQWAVAMGGATADKGSSIAIDASGNVYTTGYFFGTADFDPGVGTFTLASVGSNDAFISKLDASGNFVWAKSIGSSTSSEGTSIAVDANDNVYITGVFNGIADFDPGVGTSTITSIGASDIFVIKLDANGNFVWAKQIGGTSSDNSRALALDVNNNVYITGWFSNTVDFDPGVGTNSLTSSGLTDIFVWKLDASGNYVWAKQMGGTSTGDQGNAIKVDPSGNVYTTGSYSTTADFNPGAGTYTLTSQGATDAFISKLDASGNFVWAKSIGGTNVDNGFSLELDVFGNVYSTGTFNGTVDFDPSAATYTFTSFGSSDIYINKLDASGNFLWAKQMGGSIFDQGQAIATDATGNVYTTGYFQTTADFDPGVGTYTLSAIGGADVFINKLDASGNFLWAKAMGANNSDVGLAIKVDAANNVYTAGTFYATVDFDPGVATYTLSSNTAPYTDIFILKLSQCSPVSVTASTSNVSCYSGSNGTATVSPSGGSGFTYTWSPIGGNAAIASGLTAGIYTCVIENNCGSVFSQTVSITQPSLALNVSSSVTNALCNGGIGSVTVSANGGISPYSGVGTFTMVAGTNTFSVTDNNGCISTTSATITQPIAITHAQSFTICNSQSITVGSNIYSSAGTYTTVVPSLLQGCDSTIFTSLTVNALPSLTATTSNSLLCIGQSATLSVSGASTYTWSTTETASDIAVSPTVQTTYTVEGTDSQGCSNSTTIFQDVSLCTGIYKLTNSVNGFYVYPNPSNGIYTIQLNSDYTITILDILGKTIYTRELKEGKHSININEYINGVYILKAENDENIKTMRLIKD